MFHIRVAGSSQIPSLTGYEPKSAETKDIGTEAIEPQDLEKGIKSFIQDLSQTQKISKFSKESKDLIADLNSTEIFELCEN